MFFWLRELLGWLLILAGLYCFYAAIGAVLSDRALVISSSYPFVIGFVVFRGGLTILKVSVAGKICLDARREAPGRPGAARVNVR